MPIQQPGLSESQKGITGRTANATCYAFTSSAPIEHQAEGRKALLVRSILSKPLTSF